MPIPSHRRRLIFTTLAAILLLFAGVIVWRALAHGGTLADALERRLSRVTSVQGRLTITLQGVSLQQELWVVRPHLLRTETEQGPGAFAGTIVVLNEQEGWVYTPALDMASVVDRQRLPCRPRGSSGRGIAVGTDARCDCRGAGRGQPLSHGDRRYGRRARRHTAGTGRARR